MIFKQLPVVEVVADKPARVLPRLVAMAQPEAGGPRRQPATAELVVLLVRRALMARRGPILTFTLAPAMAAAVAVAHLTRPVMAATVGMALRALAAVVAAVLMAESAGLAARAARAG